MFTEFMDISSVFHILILVKIIEFLLNFNSDKLRFIWFDALQSFKQTTFCLGAFALLS